MTVTNGIADGFADKLQGLTAVQQGVRSHKIFIDGEVGCHRRRPMRLPDQLGDRGSTIRERRRA